MEISWFLVALLAIGIIALFFSRIAGRGGSRKNSYNRSNVGSPGFMFVDSNSGYSGGDESYDSDEDDNDGDGGEGDDSDGDSPDYDDGGSYDSGDDSYDSGSDSSSSD